MTEHPTEAEAERAAAEVVHDDTVLPGELEAVESDFVEDAESWRDVYQELFLFKQQLLSTLLVQRGKISTKGRHEVQNDEILLTREADRLARRLEFWQRQAKVRQERSASR